MAADPNTAAAARQFVGRRTELDVIARLIPRTVRSGGWTVLISGPAGIGKTHLARRATVTDSGTEAPLTVWGRCFDEARSTPFWPWVQVVRRLSDDTTTGADLARLVLGGPAEGDRLELFEATASLIEDHARREPLVVVIDDIHLADAASLVLTRFLSRRLRDSAVLILITHRPVDGVDSEQAARVRTLHDENIVIELTGLDADDIATALSTTLPVDAILTATGGNPLLVQHAINGRAASADLDDHLGDILGQRIASMPAPTKRVIAALGVVGAGWSPTDLAVMLDVPATEVDAAIEAGVGADLLVRVDETLEVAHSLVAQAGSAHLDDAERSRLHLRAAELLHAPAQLTERARHLLQAGPDHLDAALDTVERCTEQALAALAPESAFDLLCDTLQLLQHVTADTTDDDALRTLACRRFELLMLLGEADWRAGDRDQAEDAFAEAREIALELDEPRRIARATLGGGVQYDFHGDRTAVVVARLRDVLGDLDDDADPLRVRLLAMLAMKLMPIDPNAARATALDALAAAQVADDPVASGHAMIADQITLLGPATLKRRVETAHQILAIGHDHNHPDLLLQGRFLLLGALLERGDVRALDAELATQERTLEEVADETQVRHSLWFRCTRALLRGSIDDAEALAEECFAVAMELGDPDGIGVYGGHITLIRWMQGRLLETEQLYLDLQAEEPNDPLWPAVLGFMWAQDGRLDAARGALDTLPPLSEIEESQHWLLTMTAVAETIALAGNDEQRWAVRDALLPYADRVVPIAMGASLWGTVARPLGVLARSLGQLDDAVEHLHRAIDITARLGAWPWLIEAQIDLAVTLFERDGHHAEVDRLVGEAQRAANRLGLARFVQQADHVAASIAQAPPERPPRSEPALVEQPPPVTDAPDDPRSIVTVCGGFDVQLPSGPAKWPSRKSRLLFRVLVAQRGRPIHREQLADRLWPDDLGGVSRLDVEVSRLRRALDPDRTAERDEYVVVRDGTIRLQTERFDIDIENILRAADVVDTDPAAVSTEHLHALCSRHSGAAFAEDAYADWAIPIRDAVDTAICVLLRELATRQATDGQLVAAASSLRSVLAIDEYNSAAHEALISTLEAAGSHGLAAVAAEQFAEAMAALGVDAPAASDQG